MIELNLLPDVKKDFIKAQRSRNMLITGSILTVMIALGATILFALFVYGGQSFRISQLTSDIKTKEKALKEVKDIDKYLTIQNQLSKIDGLHQDKLIYSRLVDFLGMLNPSAPNNIQLNNLKVDGEAGTIVFEGSAPSYEAFNVFKDTLQNADVNFTTGDEDKPTVSKEKLFDPVVVNASALSSQGGKPSVSFTVTTTYSKNVFSAQARQVSVSVPNMETTNSVRQSPQPLFDSKSKEGGQQ